MELSMRTVYTWTFPYFDVAPSEDGLTDVVKTIHWRYRLDSGEFYAEVYGATGLDSPDGSSFIPYDQITELWAIQMVSAKTDVEQLQQGLLQNIADQENPPSVPMQPPFSSN